MARRRAALAAAFRKARTAADRAAGAGNDFICMEMNPVIAFPDDFHQTGPPVDIRLPERLKNSAHGQRNVADTIEKHVSHQRHFEIDSIFHQGSAQSTQWTPYISSFSSGK